MKKILLPAFLTALTGALFAQSASKDYAVMLRAEVQESPASIKIKWPLDKSTGVQYFVFRKTSESRQWTDTLATLDSTATELTDNNVTAGKTYEYFVKKRKPGLTMYGQPSNSSYYYPFATGYIRTGIKIPARDSRGKLILLVDQNYVTPLAAEITTLENDLIGDGWEILRHDIARSATVVSVKQTIASDVSSQSNVKSLYLLGHIPVPYSGGFKAASGFDYPPDGHPDHSGAWPADLYYGTMNEGVWTDANVIDSTSGRTQNRNLPGDGKFDQNEIYPDSVSLEIGRVDFVNLPAFGLSDTVLMKRYLNKAHNFKIGLVKAERRGLVSDNFGPMSGEAFASSGYRPFAAMFGDSVKTVGGGGAYLTEMRTNSYLWAYGTGAGSYTSVGGIGTTTDFANDSLKNVFSMLFGSYFGDWDAQNNVLRAPLAHKGWTLTCMWSGRPYGIMHPMAIGENIGYCTRLSQNNLDETFYLNPRNNKGYSQNYNPTSIHLALMGDPSLRLHPVLPVTNLALTTINQQRHVVLTWNRSADVNITSYRVYRSNARNGVYSLLGTVQATDSTYTDGTALDGVNYYQVKAVKLESSFSGTYYNTSLGAMDTISARRYVGISDMNGDSYFTLYPNPAADEFYIKAAVENASITVSLFDINGHAVRTAEFGHVQSTQSVKMDVAGLANGVYYVQIKDASRSTTQKLVLMR